MSLQLPLSKTTSLGNTFNSHHKHIIHRMLLSMVKSTASINPFSSINKSIQSKSNQTNKINKKKLNNNQHYPHHCPVWQRLFHIDTNKDDK
eukprot:86832_1